MSNIKKFAFDSGNLFSLSGQPYTGYFNIVNGEAYAGKYTQSVPLQNNTKIQNIITRSDLFFNRLPMQDFTLTYSLSDFVYQPNEFINANALDNKLRKAYINFLDTYRACFMASSDLPDNFTAVAKVATSGGGRYQFVWTSTSTNTFVPDLSVYNINFGKSSKLLYIKNLYTDNNTLIVANLSSLFVYKINQLLNTFTFTFSTVYIETTTPDYGLATYNRISDIAYDGSTLFVCDSGLQSVLSYDITGVLSEDRALGSKFNLKHKLDLNRPSLVCSSDKRVYVYNSDDRTVEFYDKNYNLVNTYTNTSLFSLPPVALAYYAIYNQVFVLLPDFKLVIINDDGSDLVIQLSTRGIQQDELARRIVFSNSNSDVMYVLSNKTIYKKFVSNIVDNIGSYSFTQGITGTNTINTGTVLYDLATNSTNVSADDLILFGYNQMIRYLETTSFNSLLK